MASKIDVDIKQLLQSGAHFGHKTSRWHPKMAPYIHSKKNGSHIIDLTTTVEKLEVALDFLTETAAAGKQVLLVSTKPQAQAVVKQAAEELGMPYVVERWLGGMLTNQNTIGGRIKYLKSLEEKMANGELANKYNKLEVQRFAEEIEEMNHLYGGIKDMHAKVGAVFVIDVTTDVNAVREAKKLGIPVVGLADTNADPTNLTYFVPCNDDATKTIALVVDYVKQAIAAGKARAKDAAPAKEAPKSVVPDIAKKSVTEEPEVEKAKTDNADNKEEKVEKKEVKEEKPKAEAKKAAPKKAPAKKPAAKTEEK